MHRDYFNLGQNEPSHYDLLIMFRFISSFCFEKTFEDGVEKGTSEYNFCWVISGFVFFWLNLIASLFAVKCKSFSLSVTCNSNKYVSNFGNAKGARIFEGSNPMLLQNALFLRILDRAPNLSILTLAEQTFKVRTFYTKAF